MRISRLYLVAFLFMLIGILVWFDQYWQGYEFRMSDLFDDRIHHEKITVAAFIIAASISVWEFTSRRRTHDR